MILAAPIVTEPAATRATSSGPTHATASTAADEPGLKALRARAERMLRAHPVASIAIGVALGLLLARVAR